MPSNPHYHSVSLSKEAYEALKKLQDEIAADLGFPPTYSQAVLHVLHKSTSLCCTRALGIG